MGDCLCPLDVPLRVIERRIDKQQMLADLMHAMAHDLYDPNDFRPVHGLSQEEVKEATMPYTRRNDVPTMFFDRNYRAGMEGIVRTGRFRDMPNVVFSFPPMKFSTHDMDHAGDWTMRIRQKTAISRPWVALYNEDGFGMRIRLKAQHYRTLEDVFEQMVRGYRVEMCEHSMAFKSMPVPVVHVHPAKTWEVEATLHVDNTGVAHDPIDLVELVRRDNDRRLAELGDWRSGKPSMENVINIEDYFERLTKEPNPQPLDIRDLLEKFG